MVPLARSVMFNSTSIYPLLDCIEEQGEMMVRFETGRCYYIETFGKSWVGRVVDATYTEVVLEDAAWVADTGRYNTFLGTGRSEQMEVEPTTQRVTIPLAYVSSKMDWPHPLFAEAV